MSQVSIRRARPADADRVSALAVETFPAACPPGTTRQNIDLFCSTELSPQSFEGYLRDSKIRIWVADLGDELDGYVMTVDGDPQEYTVSQVVMGRPTVELNKLYVRARAHGTGVAYRLLGLAIEHARNLGAQSVWLGTNKENSRANAFYDRHGFHLVGERLFRVGDSLEEDFIREKVILECQ